MDEHNRPPPGAQSSYVCLHPVEHTPEPAAPTASTAKIQADTTTQLINALLEAQKQLTELARMYVAQFPVLVNALSGVVRSAGDAGLPARVPLVVPVAPEVKSPEPTAGDKDDTDEDDEEVEITVKQQTCYGITTTPKGRTRRTIPMTSTLEQALRRLEVVREGFVVRNLDGSQKTDGQANAVILRICRRAGLPLKRWHTLRHTFGTHAALFG